MARFRAHTTGVAREDTRTQIVWFYEFVHRHEIG
jgi:hypothetical protein